jgi:Phage tail assembly chaperone protein
MIINRIYNPLTIRISYYDDYGVDYPQPPEGSDVVDKPYTYDEAMAALRAERDRRLQLCDWTQLPDVPLSSTQVQAWRTYRKALRDTPEHVEAQGWSGAVDWPTPPAS